jgi:predicted ABC-type ATPase
MKMNDKVKYQLERAEDALRTALTFADKENVYVIAAISKALTELDNTLFAERIEAAAKKGDLSVAGLSSLTKEDTSFEEIEKRVNAGGYKWNNKTEFVPAAK